jgi:PIN domain nuclease of toxin-antitoxin system
LGKYFITNRNAKKNADEILKDASAILAPLITEEGKKIVTQNNKKQWKE